VVYVIRLNNAKIGDYTGNGPCGKCAAGETKVVNFITRRVIINYEVITFNYVSYQAITTSTLAVGFKPG